MKALFYRSTGGDADQESLAALNDLLQVQPAVSMDVADAKRHRSVVVLRLGRFTEAESLIREAIDVHQELLGPNNSHVAHDMLILTRVLKRSGRGEEAIRHARQTLELAERVTIERDILRHQAYQSLASLLEPVSPAEAIDVWAKAISAKQQVVGNHIEVAKLLHRQAGLYVRLEKLPEAIECYQRSLQTLRESPPPESNGGFASKKPRDAVEGFFFLAALDLVGPLLELERAPDAQVVVDEIRLRAESVESAIADCIVEIATARMHLANGDPNAAKRDIDSALAKLDDAAHFRIQVRAILVQGEILTQLEQFNEARRQLKRAYRMLRQRQGPLDHFEYSVAKQLAILFVRCNRPNAAAAWLERANSIRESSTE